MLLYTGVAENGYDPGREQCKTFERHGQAEEARNGRVPRVKTVTEHAALYVLTFADPYAVRGTGQFGRRRAQ